MTLNRPTKPLFRFRCKQNSGLEQCRKAILPHSFFYWRCYVTFGRMFIYLPLFCVHFILPKFTRSSNHLEMDHAQRTLNKVMFNNKISYFSAWSGHCLFFYLFLWGLPLSLGIVLEKGHFEEIAMTILINVFCNQIFSSCADNFPSIWCELISISCCISFAPRWVIFDRIHPFLCTHGTFNSFDQL